MQWSIPQLQAWVDGLVKSERPFLAIAGPRLLRDELFKGCYKHPGLLVLGASRHTQDWLKNSVLDDLTQRVRELTGRPWGLVWDLLLTRDFVVDEPLRGLLDQGPALTGLFKALWEARFLLQEGRRTETMALLGAVFRWMRSQELTDNHRRLLKKVHIKRDLVSSHERFEMLLLLLALAYQNGLTDRTVFVIDGLEGVVRTTPDKREDLLQQLDESATSFTRWSQLGSAAGLVFGFEDASGTLEFLAQYSFGKILTTDG